MKLLRIVPCMAVVLGLTFALGCVTSSGELPAEQFSQQAESLEDGLRAQELRPLEPDELRVRLAFGLDADLDLFLTDPSLESIYFANKASRTGGVFDSDVRCDAPAPRIEVVTLRRPRPGRYRVGVDFPTRCDKADGRVVLVVAVELRRRDGTSEIQFHRQEIALEVFEPIVYEFDLP